VGRAKEGFREVTGSAGMERDGTSADPPISQLKSKVAVISTLAVRLLLWILNQVDFSALVARLRTCALNAGICSGGGLVLPL
jgi:hypothetical protein